MLNWSQNLGL